MLVLTIAAIAAALGRLMSRKKPLVTVDGIARTARFAGLLFGGLFAGFLVAVLVLELPLRRFGASVYIQVRHVELIGLDALAVATLVPALVTTAFVVIVDRTRGRTFWLTLTALVLLVLVLAISFLINLPINTEQLTWTVQMPPAHWASTRDLWQVSHVLRTSAAVLALGCLSAAALIKNAPPPRTLGNTTGLFQRIAPSGRG